MIKPQWLELPYLEQKSWSQRYSSHWSSNIATDKVLFSSEKCWYRSYFSTKTYVVGTHNICISREIRKILCGYPLLSVGMVWRYLQTSRWLSGSIRASDFGFYGLGLNPTGGRIQLMTSALYCTKLFIIILPSSQYDINNVERDVKHQIIIRDRQPDPTIAELHVT